MTRQFKTIEDAVPHTFRYAGTSGGEGNVEVRKENGERMRIDTPIFTAAETAKIAKMYLAAYLKEKKALFRPDKENKPAEANLRAIRKKISEWEKL